jgi:hypothetical protein
MKTRLDTGNRRFLTETACPWPDCGVRVEPTLEDKVLCWCQACSRPYEAVLHAPADGGPPVEWTLRASCGFDTFTGRKIQRYSALDWSEAGGEPGRSSCADDPHGTLFGAPHDERAWTLEPAWSLDTVAPGESSGIDAIAALAVLRGHVLAVTRRGRLGLVEPELGMLRHGRPIDWPGYPPPGAGNAVDFPPLVRGTNIVLTSPRQACFRDLSPQLFGGLGGGHQLVDASSPDRQFVGPPLGLDLPGVPPRACLLEARARRAGEWSRRLEEPTLRVFDLAGDELERIEAPEIARPPVFDGVTGQVLWVDRNGFVSCWRPGQSVRTLLSEDVLELTPSLRSSFCVAPDAEGEPELWVGWVEAERGELVLARTRLRASMERDELRWTTRRLGQRGELVGLAVGRGPRRSANAAANLVAVATDQGVFSFPRELADAMEHDSARGHESAERRGSWDAPLLCSAGVLARVPGSLQLLSHGLGWRPRSSSIQRLELRYTRPQGLALYGRRVFLGAGMGLRAFLLQPETR